MQQEDIQFLVDLQLALHAHDVPLGGGESTETLFQRDNFSVQVRALIGEGLARVIDVSGNAEAGVADCTVQSAHRVVLLSDINECSGSRGAQFEQLVHLLNEERIFLEEIGRRGQPKLLYAHSEIPLQRAHGFQAKVELPLLRFKLNERVEKLILFSAQIQNILVLFEQIDLLFQAVHDGSQLVQLDVDETLRAIAGIEFRFPRVTDVCTRQGVQKLQPASWQCARRLQGQDAGLRDVLDLQCLPELVDALPAAENPNAEMLLSGFLNFSRRGPVELAVFQGHRQGQIRSFYGLVESPNFLHFPPTRMHVAHNVRVGRFHKQINVHAEHVRIEQIRPSFNLDVAEPFHLTRAHASDEKVVNGLIQLVHRSPDQIVTLQNPKLVLHIVAQRGGPKLPEHLLLVIEGLLTFQQNLGSGAVDIELPMGDQFSSAVTQSTQQQQQPPVLAQQFEVRAQVTEVDQVSFGGRGCGHNCRRNFARFGQTFLFRSL